MIKRVVRRVSGVDAEIAPARANRVTHGRVVSHVSIRRILDILDQATEDFRRFRVSRRINRLDLDLRLIHPRIVHNLTNKCLRLVQSQAGTALALALLYDCRGPLFTQPDKPQILLLKETVLAVCVPAKREAGMSLRQKVVCLYNAGFNVSGHLANPLDNHQTTTASSARSVLSASAAARTIV